MQRANHLKAKAQSTPGPARDVLLKSAGEAGDQIKAKSRAESEQSVETMKKRGLTVHAVTREVEAEWRKVAEEVYPKVRAPLFLLTCLTRLDGCCKNTDLGAENPKNE